MCLTQSKESFRKPNIDLLIEIPNGKRGVEEEELKRISTRIEAVLAFNEIKASVLSMTPGPILTQFKVRLEGIGHEKEFSRVGEVLAKGLWQPAIRVKEEVVCNVEVPNANRQKIFLREIIDSNAFKENPSKLTLALGLSSSGDPVVTDLAKAPHILVSGFIGSGKSVALHAMILSLLFKCSPEDLRLVLIDSKKQKFEQYGNIPHLLTPVVSDDGKAVYALQWCVKELERRYDLMRKAGVRNIVAFNQKLEQSEVNRASESGPADSIPEDFKPLKRLPYLVIMIDELGDILVPYGKQAEASILRLAQKGRAAGIHLILSTQRPNNKVLTPIIRTNCPTRICFKVTDRSSSEMVLGESGAEDLLCPGDMFFLRAGADLMRVHGANVTGEEIKQVTAFLKERGEPNYEEGVTEPSEDDIEALYPNYHESIEKVRGTEKEHLTKDRESYQKSDLSLLKASSDNLSMVGDEAQAILGMRIEHILETYRIRARVISALAGPIVTSFQVRLGEGVHIKKIVQFAKDLARELGVPTVRIDENTDSIGCIGLEVPNAVQPVIPLRQIIGASAFTESKSKLALALGLSIKGEPVVIDLAKAPHLLVAGSPGSGKTVGLHSMILSLLLKCSPQDLKLVLIDPKMKEFAPYEDIPHLLIPVLTDTMKATRALLWCVNEMERRYSLMRKVGVKNIAAFNQKIEQAEATGSFIQNPMSLTAENPEPLKRMPYIVVMVDELADLLLMHGKHIEPAILRLTQKGRAAGLHLILATQRPSNDIVTPLIKANCPTRISFKVENRYGSTTILGESGAEDLLGRGDMFLMRSGHPLTRVHGANVTDDEIKEATDFLKEQGVPDYEEGGTEPIEEEEPEPVKCPGPNSEYDSLYDRDCQIVLTEKKCSISYLQRLLGIGYNRAAGIVEQMEKEGLVSGPTPTDKREVFGLDDLSD